MQKNKRKRSEVKQQQLEVVLVSWFRPGCSPNLFQFNHKFNPDLDFVQISFRPDFRRNFNPVYHFF